LLAERLTAPLTAPKEIECRLDAVAFFVDEPGLRKDVRVGLKAAPDMTRALSRLALNRGGPRDLAAVCAGIEAADAVARMLAKTGRLPQ
jgi:DNA mismatch repair protein MutS